MTIIVEIKKGDASTHRFRQQLVSNGSIIVNECDPRLFGNINELRRSNIRAGIGARGNKAARKETQESEVEALNHSILWRRAYQRMRRPDNSRNFGRILEGL